MCGAAQNKLAAFVISESEPQLDTYERKRPDHSGEMEDGHAQFRSIKKAADPICSLLLGFLWLRSRVRGSWREREWEWNGGQRFSRVERTEGRSVGSSVAEIFSRVRAFKESHDIEKRIARGMKKTAQFTLFFPSLRAFAERTNGRRAGERREKNSLGSKV